MILVKVIVIIVSVKVMHVKVHLPKRNMGVTTGHHQSQLDVNAWMVMIMTSLI